VKPENKKPPLSEKLLRELANLATESSRNKFIASHPRLLTDAVVQQLNEVVRGKLRENAREALSLAESSVAIARPLKIRRRWVAACDRKPTLCTCWEKISKLWTSTPKRCASFAK
jgi:hypothetical protein